MNTIEIAAASVPGARHRAAGVGNQDALHVARRGDRMVAVVCDGCGSAKASGVGAYLGARLVGEALLAADLEAATAVVTDRLRAIVAPLGDGALAEAFLFTVVGALFTAERATFFALGDGVIVCNDERVELGPFEDNAPPYLAYRLLDGRDVALTPVLTRPRAEIERFLIGTDGACDLPADARFDPRFFEHEDALRRRLTQLSQPGVRVTAAGSERTPSVLTDDTTVIVGRRVWK